MKNNMGTLDRRLRALILAPAAVLIGILVGPGSLGAVVLYVLAAVMLGTSAVGYCPLYSVFHLDSRSYGPLPQ